jgi:8-oxo-dGTP diphosphatase/2-hydroxy-dATP diphosphatase
MRTPLTLCVLQDKDRVLLGMKKVGFGAGRWNGFGGKLEPGETVEQATKREMVEESGVIVESIDKMGQIDFEFAAKPGDILEVHIYRAEKWTGDPRESEEMKPEWWKVTEIPFNKMWPDDRYWMPLFLAKKKFTGRFLFGPNDSVLEYTLRVVG